MILISRKQAIASGAKHYCTGEPCKRGHLANRLVSNRQCVVCQTEGKNKAKQAAYYSRPDVKLSRKEYMKKYWANRKLKLSEEEREKQRQATRRWREKNREFARALDRQCAERRKEKRHAYAKEYQKRFPERAATRERNKRARKRENGGTHTHAEIVEIKKLQRGKCAYCKLKLGDRFHVDHIVPIVKGGRNDRANLQILCAPCNHRKYSKDPMDFARSMGRLL
jgi:5-methylcytosine-specific restriction endonuclease McrA